MMTPAARSCSSRGILYLLVEESAREMPARLLIAIQAARLGFEVVIGPQWALVAQARRLPPGVVLFKGNNRIQVDNMARMRAAGHAIASIEEEVLGLISEARIVEQYDRRIGAVCDLLLCQGDFQRDCLTRAFPGFAGAIETTGNPRLDFLRAPLNARTLAAAEAIRTARADRGPFILINSNYSSINPKHGDTLTNFRGWVQAGFVDLENQGDIDEYLDFCGWERQNLRALLRFFRAAGERGLGGRMVLRPHPAEATWRWREGLVGDIGLGDNETGGIEIVEDGDHLAWIAASALLVHTSCTTGLEAAILGAPAINLDAASGPRSSDFGSYVANPRVTDPSAAAALAQARLDAPDQARAAAKPAPGWAEHWCVEETSAAEKIAHRLADLRDRRGLDGARDGGGDGAKDGRLDGDDGRDWDGGGGALSLDDAGLTSWQVQKFAPDPAVVQNDLTEFLSMLGIPETVVLETLPGSSFLLRSPR